MILHTIFFQLFPTTTRISGSQRPYVFDNAKLNLSHRNKRSNKPLDGIIVDAVLLLRQSPSSSPSLTQTLCRQHDHGITSHRDALAVMGQL